MADEILTTSIDELASIAVAEANLSLRNGIDLASLITRRDLAPGQISVRFPIYASVAAAALTEGNEAANTAVTTTGVVLTPTTNAVIAHAITDLADHAAPQLMVDLGRKAADAIRKKRNADIFALFDGFSNALGTTNVDITEALIRQAKKILMQNDADGIPYLVLTPEVAEDLLGLYSLNTSNTADNVRDAVYAGQMPVIYGVRPFVINGPTETTDLKCGMFTREALGIAVAWEVKVEIQRRAKLVGYDFVASSAYAVGEINDGYGVELLVDGAD